MYPFERFTEGAKQILIRTKEEAGAAGAAYIGTEHLALAMCRDEGGIVGRVLADLGVTRQALEAHLGAILAHAAEKPRVTQIIPESRMKRVIELAFQEATNAGVEFVGTQHLLVALLVEGEGVAARALDELGATLPRVKSAVRAAIDERRAESGSALSDRVGTSSSLSVALMRAAQLAKEEGARDIRADHLVRAMAASELSDIRGVLRKLGLAPKAVEAQLTVPEEIRQLGLAARTASVERARAFDAGGAEAATAVEAVERANRDYAKAVSHWLAEGTA